MGLSWRIQGKLAGAAATLVQIRILFLPLTEKIHPLPMIEPGSLAQEHSVLTHWPSPPLLWETRFMIVIKKRKKKKEEKKIIRKKGRRRGRNKRKLKKIMTAYGGKEDEKKMKNKMKVKQKNSKRR